MIRNYIESMTQKMCEVLSNMEYRYTEEAVRKIIIKWADNKALLFNLLSHNENFVPEKGYIAFSQDYYQEFNEHDRRLFVEWFDLECDSISECIIPEEKTTEKMSYASHIPLKLYQFVEEFLSDYNNQYVNEEFVDYVCTLTDLADFRNGGKKLRIEVGQKTSRAVNKIMTYFGVNKHERYNKIYAKYSDAINPLSYKRHTIISVNPIDYLLSSNGLNWSSCHNADIGGYYKVGKKGKSFIHASGTISYMLDDCTLIMYTVDEAYNGTDFELQPKINRCCLHYKDGVLVQSRLYPQDCDDDNPENLALYDGFRSTAQKVIADLLNKPNLWTKLKNNSASLYTTKGSGATCYADWSRRDATVTVCLLKNYERESEDRMIIGHQPICVECGCYHSLSYHLSCCHQWSEDHYCSNCGSTHLRSEMHLIDGKYYCKECMDTCDYTGELLVRNKLFKLSNGKKVAIEYGVKEKIILPLWDGYYKDNSYAEKDNAVILDGHGDSYILKRHIGDYHRCKECGKLFHRNYTFNCDGWYYCEEHFPINKEDITVVEVNENDKW